MSAVCGLAKTSFVPFKFSTLSEVKLRLSSRDLGGLASLMTLPNDSLTHTARRYLPWPELSQCGSLADSSHMRTLVSHTSRLTLAITPCNSPRGAPKAYGEC